MNKVITRRWWGNERKRRNYKNKRIEDRNNC